MSEDSKELQKHVEQVLAEMSTINIANQNQYEDAAGFLKKVKQTTKMVKDYYEPERKRTHEAYKTVTDAIKSFTDSLTKAEKTVKSAMGVYFNEQERIRREEEEIRRREEEEKKLLEAIETGDEDLLDKPIVEVYKEEPPQVNGTYTVEVWKFEIKDVSKINPDFMLPDEKAIRNLVKSKKGEAAKILGEGVKVYSEKDIRSRI